ncbi:hypothetical protein GE061_002953 [Apolygus lucorum]|uniref:Uncharacterized protein n=1 Tax=Apolygus lucorum TaxID=248454 RepID=A0A8S9X4P1_APOLU|nr:hypothetical protein GE061_002953 [Apolygus lucorum]
MIAFLAGATFGSISSTTAPVASAYVKPYDSRPPVHQGRWARLTRWMPFLHSNARDTGKNEEIVTKNKASPKTGGRNLRAIGHHIAEIFRNLPFLGNLIPASTYHDTIDSARGGSSLVHGQQQPQQPYSDQSQSHFFSNLTKGVIEDTTGGLTDDQVEGLSLDQSGKKPAKSTDGSSKDPTKEPAKGSKKRLLDKKTLEASHRLSKADHASRKNVPPLYVNPLNVQRQIEHKVQYIYSEPLNNQQYGQTPYGVYPQYNQPLYNQLHLSTVSSSSHWLSKVNFSTPKLSLRNNGDIKGNIKKPHFQGSNESTTDTEIVDIEINEPKRRKKVQIKLH